MNEHIRRHTESVRRDLLRQAESLYYTGQYKAALNVLDRLDSAFPNDRAVLYQRGLVLRELGIRSEEDRPQEPSVVPEDIGQTWDPELDPPQPPRQLANKYEQSLAYFSPNQYEENTTVYDFEYNPPKDDLLVKIAFGVMLLFVGWAMAEFVMGEPLPGATRSFAGIPFVWIPSVLPVEAAALEQPSDPAQTAIPGFWLSKYEITRKQWAEALKDPEGRFARWPRRPVTDVSPTDALTFVAILNRLGKGQFRIPTPEDWRRARQAGAGEDELFFGNDLNAIDDYAWFAENSGATLNSVGRKSRSPWNIYDIYGNAAEYCATFRGDSLLDPNETADPAMYDWSVHGGHYRSEREELLAEGTNVDPDFADVTVGIRLARLPGPSTKEATRVLEFPVDRSLGDLYVGRVHIGPARGRVTVGETELVRLVVSPAGAKDLTPLKELDPDALYEIDAASLPIRNWQLQYISTLTELKVLNAAGTEVNDSGMRYLGQLAALGKLDLSNTRVTGSGFQLIGKVRTLKILRLRGLKNVDQTHLAGLMYMPELKLLDLSDCGLTPEMTTELQVSNPTCAILPHPEAPNPEQARRWAAINGRYSMLLHQFEYRRDADIYGEFRDAGFKDDTSYATQTDLEPGYWVYVAPYWFIWKYGINDEVNADEPWSVQNAVGRPDGNQDNKEQTAWAPADTDDIPEWLLVEFNTAIDPQVLIVHERGPATRISEAGFFNEEGVEYRTPLHRYDYTPMGRLWRIPIVKSSFDATWQSVRRVKLYLQPNVTDVVPEASIDAVGLVDRFDETHWAVIAAASSSYADRLRAEQEDANQTDPTIVDPAEVRYRGLLRLFADYEVTGKKGRLGNEGKNGVH